MNRHHPYGRGGFDGGHRRGGHQGSVGPDRSHNFSDRGGGPSRGRGGWRGGRGGSGGGGGSYGGYGGPGGYDSTPQGDSGGYDNYESGPQDSYYQSGNYGTGMPEYGSSDQSGSYGQDYGEYEGALEYSIAIFKQAGQQLHLRDILGASIWGLTSHLNHVSLSC